ncbi:unnamed protein product [Staurois parvus]|uniref:Uncharacterized protein n=1 Tax=Staurois parvus TaxID=386267 RepID=A0ABN9FEI0_9NEOB|nr:unnamed protein product [Staurois parvus]
MMSGSDILLTTSPVITDWPISDHMTGTSHRGPVQRSVFCCDRGSMHNPKWQTSFMNSNPPLSGPLYTATRREVVKILQLHCQ